MIPSQWRPCRRDDGELVGYLAPVDADGVAGVEGFAPLTLLGTPLAPGVLGADEAERMLVAGGLAGLDRRWWALAPTPLPTRTAVDGTRPAADWEWRPVVVVEVDATRCRLRPEYPAPEELGSRIVLPVPVGEHLRPE